MAASSAAIDALAVIDLGLLLIDVLLGLEALERQRLEAGEVLLERDELGLVLRLLGLGLIERRLEQPRVDLGQNVAFLDVLAFLEQHVLQLAVDLRVDADREGGLHRAKPGQVDRHVLAGRGGDADRDRGRLAARGLGGYDTTSQQMGADSNCHGQQACRYDDTCAGAKSRGPGRRATTGQPSLVCSALNRALWVWPPCRDIAVR